MSDDSEFFAPTPDEGCDGVPIRSYAEANRELVASFVRYMESRGLAAPTIRSYRDSCSRFVESLGSTSMVEASRSHIRVFLSELLDRGLAQSSARLHTAALRLFYKFIGLSGLTRHNPTLILSQRKLPGRLPRVLTVGEVEALINAARDPFEAAVAEVLYSTGVRVSECVNLKLENVDLSGELPGRILVVKGKGNKDRFVLYGRSAFHAIKKYLAWRPSTAGFLFESPSRNGVVKLTDHGWYARFYTKSVQREISIGTLHDFPTEEDARRQFERIAANIPGYKPTPAGPYGTRAIRNVLHRLAQRAGIGRVHPHALRRALACHMLSNGADIRSIQELLGHVNVATTQIYTHLTEHELKAIHTKCHPHGQENGNDTKQ